MDTKLSPDLNFGSIFGLWVTSSQFWVQGTFLVHFRSWGLFESILGSGLLSASLRLRITLGPFWVWGHFLFILGPGVTLVSFSVWGSLWIYFWTGDLFRSSSYFGPILGSRVTLGRFRVWGSVSVPYGSWCRVGSISCIGITLGPFWVRWSLWVYSGSGGHFW